MEGVAEGEEVWNIPMSNMRPGDMVVWNGWHNNDFFPSGLKNRHPDIVLWILSMSTAEIIAMPCNEYVVLEIANLPHDLCTFAHEELRRLTPLEILAKETG